MPNLKMQEYLRTRIAEVTEQIEILDEPDWVAWGYITRASLYEELGDIEAAIKDLSSAIELPEVPMDKLEDALKKRCWIYYHNNQYAAALMDIERIMLEPDIPRDRKMEARLNYPVIIRGARKAGYDAVDFRYKEHCPSH